MIELQGKYNIAKVFTDNVEATAISQIIELCNQDFVKDSKIRIMPDVHAGAGCTIGTTMTISDKIVPNLVGVDIGCGMSVMKIDQKKIDFAKLDMVIRTYLPSGFDVHKRPSEWADIVPFDKLVCAEHVNIERAKLSIGTLGGGNHFIEVNEDENGQLYLVVHSGSRNLGKQVAEYYQDLGYKRIIHLKRQKEELVKRLKAEGRMQDIEVELNKLTIPKINKQLAYVKGEDFKNYLNDMDIVQRFASVNRSVMLDIIMEKMGLTGRKYIDTIHNYININEMMLRKGAISAKLYERVIIPMNMRDGSLICVGKGNEDWNCSAPHGAGRLMSRGKAKEEVEMQDFEESMEGIWTTSVTTSTIDESPMVYKPMEEIISNIRDTVEIEKIIKPLYNYKAN